jgi:radical SAM superfamily enzyme YgiQ (UPF0313 family)
MLRVDLQHDRRNGPLQVVLVSVYELGRQPFGVASPAAWIRATGAEVHCNDLAVESLREDLLADADVVAIHVPMHTATRLAAPLARRVRELNPSVHLCFYGLYASMNEPFLRSLGADTVAGGEFEPALVSVVERLTGARRGSVIAEAPQSTISLARQDFLVPDRSSLPPLSAYAYLTIDGERQTVGYTEASRGCKHLCRHCPIVPVYGGRFRIVGRDIVLADIRQQVEAGAQHITFGDPDFLNGPKHALAIVEALHDEFPELTYDATIKIEHLLKHAAVLDTLRETGCVLITSAVEAVDNETLEIYDKNHTREDFIAAVDLLRRAGIPLNATFVTFSPWTTLDSYLDLLALIAELGLVPNVTPVQYAIRLLIPEGSRLLELDSARDLVGPFDEEALYYPWAHPDSRVDKLYEDVRDAVQKGQAADETREAIYRRVWDTAVRARGEERRPPPDTAVDVAQPTVPLLSEPWYCCAEPTEEQGFAPV